MKKNTTGRTALSTAGTVEAGRTDWERLQAMSEDEIELAALEDEDNPPLTTEQLEAGSIVSPAERRKVAIYIRLDPEILEHYRAGGPGYQTRINDDLRTVIGGRMRKAQRGPNTVYRARLTKHKERWAGGSVRQNTEGLGVA